MNSNDPKLTVLLPIYNVAPYLDQAIESVLSQTFKDFEFLIIDDGSTDDSVAIVEKYTDSRIKLVKHTVNKGLIATLNEGLALAKGEYIARIDGDDLWSSPDKLQMQFSYLHAHSDCVLIGTAATAIDADGHFLYNMLVPITDEDIQLKMLATNCFFHPSVVFNKKVALELGGFLTSDLYVEDYSLWLRMGRTHTLSNIDKPLLSYRVHTSGVTFKNNLIQARNSLKVVKENKKYYSGYLKASLKWYIQIALLSTLGPQAVQDIRLLFKRG